MYQSSHYICSPYYYGVASMRAHTRRQSRNVTENITRLHILNPCNNSKAAITTKLQVAHGGPEPSF